MPSLGADMDEGTITQWLVQPGDTVRRGDIVAVVDTDKADVDVEIFESGVIEQILVPPGERVAVGTPLAVVRPPGHTTGETARAESAPPAVASERAAVPSEPASPVLRRLARHLGVDLDEVRGTGPRGAVTRADVEAAAAPEQAAAAAPEQAPAEPERELASAGRQPALRDAIARSMTRSKREIPHYYLASDVDFSRARDWLDETNGARSVAERMLAAVLQLKAVARAALEFPEFNGFWIDDRFVASDAVHVGVAVALRGGGLVAPALHDADTKSLDELMRDLRDLVSRTRAGRLRSSEMSDPTLTVTNLGEQGVQTVFGVIYPPQVALVGFGKIVERPWAEHGMVGVRPTVSLTLSADHRASDGARGAAFLSRIDRLLQDPDSL